MNIGFKTPIQQNEPSMETPKEIPSMLKIPKEIPSMESIELMDRLYDKLSCFNFFSVIKSIFDEFVFSLHIIDNIFLIQSLYVRNVFKNIKETSLNNLLPPNICTDLLSDKRCDRKIGPSETTIDEKLMDRFRQITIHPYPPKINEKDIERLKSDMGLESIINYEFENEKYALSYIVNLLKETEKEKIKKLKDILFYVDFKDANKQNYIKSKPSPKKLIYFSEWSTLKNFVDCGDVHLGKGNETNEANCGIKRKMIDDNKHKSFKPNELKEEISYDPDLILLFDKILETKDVINNNYVKAVVRDLKIIEIIDIYLQEETQKLL